MQIVGGPHIRQRLTGPIGCGLYMVAITPSTSKPALVKDRTSLIVSNSCPTPRWLNVSHCSGMTTWRAAVSPLMVRIPREGGQSISTTS